MSESILQNRLQSLAIAGLVPLTTKDWPDQLSAVIFLQGCRWRCGYCHNPHLWNEKDAGALPWEQVQAFLLKRRGLLDAIVLSGGEPTLHPQLPLLAEQLKSFGYKVGLHTGGYDPVNLSKALPFLDWIGLDYKNPVADYEEVTLDRLSGSRFENSLSEILASGIDFEVRTTVHSRYHTEKTLLSMAAELQGQGVKKYFLQEFRQQGVRMVDIRNNFVSLRDILSDQAIQKIHQMFPVFDIRWAQS